MRYTLQSLTLVAALIVAASSCPQRNAITNFNIDAFLGKWHEVLRLPSDFETSYSCMTDEYRRVEDGIVVHSHAYNTSKGEYDTLDGVVEMAPGEVGRYVIKTNNDSAWNTTYWVLSTDYTGYMLVAGCLQGDNTEPAALMWVLVRHLPLKEDLLPNLDQILTDNGLSRDQLEEVPYQNCPLRPNIVHN